ncbi:MAG: metallophosphoesterase [Proteobacteria bacterium]|nr:metallophosphoesterase [Pseudomonadota bacterium]
MMKRYFWLLSLFVSLSMVACESDSGSKAQNPDPDKCSESCTPGEKQCNDAGDGLLECIETDGCTQWQKTSCPNDKPSCENNECIAQCSDCAIGEKKCTDSGDGILECVKTDGCTQWLVSECPSDKPVCENNECTAQCTDCTAGEIKCTDSGNGLLECIEGEDCNHWQETACPSYKSACVNNECVAQCTDCTVGEKQCTDSGDGILECTEVDGCTQWQETSCPDDTACHNNECTAQCNECVLGEKQCTDSGDGIRECIEVDGCTEWQEIACPDDKPVCDNNECKALCNQCTVGEKQCNESADGILECKNENGCAQWKETACSKDKPTCDNNECKAQCKNECKENEKRCSGADIQQCTMVDGCLKWQTTSTCAESEGVCQPGTYKCGYACGDPKGESCKPFSIVFLPDTQRYTQAQLKSYNGKYENRFLEQTKYIVKQAKDNNIKMVIHLGDITNFNEDEEWKVASTAMKELANANIPYLMLPGNHDFRIARSNTEGFDGIYDRTARSAGFNKYFKAANVKNWPTDTQFGKYVSTTNSYATMTLGNLKFLFISLEFAARKDVVCWAERLIKKHPDHYVIISTHNYLKRPNKDETPDYLTDGAYLPLTPTGVSGKELANELAKRFSNVILVASGHVVSTAHRLQNGTNGNQFIEMVVDYSSEADGTCGSSASGGVKPNSGNGWMRILTIDPKSASKNFQFKTVSSMAKSKFSTGKKEFYCTTRYDADPSNDPHHFTEFIDLRAPANGQYKVSSYAFTAREMNKETKGYQLNPAIGVNRSTGDFVAVWQDNSTTGTKDDDGKTPDGKSQNYDIAARIFCRTGCNQLDKSGDQIAQFFVNDNKKGHQYSPAAAMDDNGNFVVVWVDDQNNTGNGQIVMRGFDPLGNERFKTTTVNTNTKGNHNKPQIAMTKDGDFIVAWQDASASAKTPQIYVRGFNSKGTEKFAQHNVLDADEGIRENPDIAIANDGSFVVTWQDDTDSNNSYQIRARAFNADGKANGDVFTVNSQASGQQMNPSIAMNPETGTFFITYEDNNNDNKTYGIKVRGYNKDKSTVFDDQYIKFKKLTFKDKDKKEYTVEYINTPVKGQPQQYSDVCIDQKGNAYITWFGLEHRTIDPSKTNEKIVDLSPDVQKITIKYENGKYTLAEKPSPVNSIPYEVEKDQSNVVNKHPVIGCNNAGHVILWREMLDKKKVSEIYGRGF